MNEPKQENFLNQSLDQIMSDRFGKYSKYVIQERALPDARDGLKPVQRRILFAMSDLGLLFNKAFKKSARVVGEVIGKYHPHGDSSIYEAMVRMSQDWKINMPLIEMHGNNGSIDDDPAAAMRYTEARLEKISSVLMENIEKKTVLFSPNFDDSEKEPTILPGTFPNLLVNGSKGIASGYATEMPPHNLIEVIDAIIFKISSPNARLSSLTNIIQGPDFPTGGIVQGARGIYEAFERGKGRIVIRSKYVVDDKSKTPSITITEIPYGVVKSKLVRELDEIRFYKKVSGIKEVRDETDRKGISIKIELESGVNTQEIINYLLSKTELQIYYNYNNVAIKDKKPVQMSLIDILDSFVNHQKEVQIKALEFDLLKFKKRLEIVEGLIKAATIVDQIIEIVKKAEGSKQGVIKSLISIFHFSELQATAIAELRLYRLSKTDQTTYLEEKEILLSKVEKIERILSTDDNLNKYLIEILRTVKKEYGVPRKTVIQSEVENISIDMNALVKKEDVWIGISQEGYIKRFSNKTFLANNLLEYGLKETDSLVYINQVNTVDKLLIFTSKGNYYFVSIHKIKEEKFKNVGTHLNDFAFLSLDERIVNAISVKDFDVNAYITLATKLGKAKRVYIKDFEVTRINKIYSCFKLQPDDELVDAKVSNGHLQFIAISTQGRAIKFSEIQIPTQGIKASGVKVMSLNEKQYIATFVLAKQTDVIGLISNRAGLKRIKVEQILPMSKNTMGRQVYRELKNAPHISIDAQVVLPSTKALFFADKIYEFEFKNFDITTSEEGFSLSNLKKIKSGKIMHFTSVSVESDFLKVDPNISEEDKFKAAENIIENMKQINIDDILKGK